MKVDCSDRAERRKMLETDQARLRAQIVAHLQSLGTIRDPRIRAELDGDIAAWRKQLEEISRKLKQCSEKRKRGSTDGESGVATDRPRQDRRQPRSAVPRSSDPGVDFLIVTALKDERAAVLKRLPGYSKNDPSEDDVEVYYTADLPAIRPSGKKLSYKVVVMAVSGMGRVKAGIAAAHAIGRWHPRYLVLVGIAGGIAAKKVALGDILVSTQVVDYELQKLAPKKLEVRWEVHQADPRLLKAIDNFKVKSWNELGLPARPDRNEPNIHAGPIATGDKIVASGRILAKYRKYWKTLIGVEMEAGGVATAAFQSAVAPGFFMIRGVSDLADARKNSKRVEKWRPYACNVAAAYTITFLRSGPVPQAPVPNRKK
jgi:nucleoside phosphorylase